MADPVAPSLRPYIELRTDDPAQALRFVETHIRNEGDIALWRDGIWFHVSVKIGRGNEPVYPPA